MNITIQRVVGGFLVRVRAGVPSVFIPRAEFPAHPRERVARFVAQMWEYARP